MPDTEETTERLKDYSTRTNTNAMQIALVDQRMAISEKRLDEYYTRLGKTEADVLVVKTVQAIHDTQLASMRKILVGNGDRETIPMDLDRLERNIQDILKVDWKTMQIQLRELEKLRDSISTRTWQIWMLIIGLLLTSLWNFIVR